MVPPWQGQSGGYAVAEDLEMFPGKYHDERFPLQHFRLIGPDSPVKIVDEKDIDLEESVE